jgi:hypothetical protein
MATGNSNIHRVGALKRPVGSELYGVHHRPRDGHR